MSNPGVIELASDYIGGINLRIEDNIGECIHIHYGNIRFDMSIKEFLSFANSLIDMAEIMIDVPDFSFSKYDAIFLTGAHEVLCGLKSVEFIDVNVDELTTDYVAKDFAGLVPLKDARIIQALKGDSRLNDIRKQKNYWGESNADRLRRIHSSIAVNGYNPQKFNSYIVLIDGGRYIIDGCHRASCLLDIFGNIKISVAMWHTKNSAYTDEQKKLVLCREQRNIKLKAQSKAEQKRLVMMLLKADLTGKNVIIKGAGKHTEELLPILRECEINIVGITADKNDGKDILCGLPFIKSEYLPQTYADVILLSSFQFRREMRDELTQYEDKFDIYDIYDHGIVDEFF